MKMIVLFLFVFISGVFAGNANSQETKVSISKNNKPIREILGEIERQTDYLFVYSEKEVDVNQRKTVNVSQQRVADVLSSLFRSTNVGYAMEGHNIMLMAKTTQTDAVQQKTSYYRSGERHQRRNYHRSQHHDKGHRYRCEY